MSFWKKLNQKSYWIFLLISSLFGIGLSLYVTAKYGAGVGGDSVAYLSTADNIIAGQGFFDHNGHPLVWWPPLYPIILAGLKLFFGGDILVIGTFLQAILFGINICLSGVIFNFVFRDCKIFRYFGILIFISSDFMLHMHSEIITEPLFMVFMLGFMLASASYIKSQSLAALYWLIITTALASLTRWPGLALVVTGGLIILWIRRKNIPLLIKEGSVFGLLSIFPFGMWILVHNIFLNKTFMGRSLWGGENPLVFPWVNFSLSLTKILHWFLPLHKLLMPILFNPVFFLLFILGISVLLNKKKDWVNFIYALSNPYALSSLLIAAIYSLVIIFTIVTNDHKDLTVQRYYLVIMPSVLIFVLIWLKYLFLPNLRIKQKNMQAGLIFLFAIWMIYPIFSLYKHVVVIKESGIAWNHRDFHEMSVIQETLKISETNENAIWYSNYTDVIWLFTRSSVMNMPSGSGLSDDEFVKKYQGWPGKNPGYIVWFLPNEFKHLMPIELLSQIADLELVYKDKSGIIYYVQPQVE